VDKGFSDGHQHHLRWCKVLGLTDAKLEERSTDTLLNADGESTDGVQDLLAPIVNSGYPEGIAAEIQHSVRTIASVFIIAPLGVDYSPFHLLLLSIVCQ